MLDVRAENVIDLLQGFEFTRTSDLSDSSYLARDGWYGEVVQRRKMHMFIDLPRDKTRTHRSSGLLVSCSSFEDAGRDRVVRRSLFEVQRKWCMLDFNGRRQNDACSIRRTFVCLSALSSLSVSSGLPASAIMEYGRGLRSSAPIREGRISSDEAINEPCCRTPSSVLGDIGPSAIHDRWWAGQGI
jgi:hypothetical protein